MKTFVVIFVACFVALVRAEEDYVEASRYLEACYSDLGITEGFVGDLTERQEKCATACMYKAMQFISDDGKVNIDAIAANSDLSVETIQSQVEQCQEIVGDVKEDLACELAACFQENNFLF